MARPAGTGALLAVGNEAVALEGSEVLAGAADGDAEAAGEEVDVGLTGALDRFEQLAAAGGQAVEGGVGARAGGNRSGRWGGLGTGR